MRHWTPHLDEGVDALENIEHSRAPSRRTHVSEIRSPPESCYPKQAEGESQLLRAYLLVIGVSFLSCGVWLALETLKRRQSSLRALGQIVGVVSQTDRDEHTYFFARIVFLARDGACIEFVSRVGNACPPPLGQVLPVIYTPQNPYEAEEDAFPAQWGFPLALGFLGAVSLAVALFSPLA